MLFNKKKRIQYLGFDDKWFMVIGIIVLSFITDYLFSKSFFRYSWGEAMIGWSISLFFTIFNWSVIRFFLIFFRKRFPHFRDNLKRIVLFLLAIVGSVLIVDFIGNFILAKSIGEDYHSASLSQILVPIVLISMMTMAIYEAVYYYVRLRKSIRDEEQSKRAIVQAQLDALRNQAQPHFLFNSLNTLRDIIDQNSKVEAKQFVDKLADVYRFILDSGSVNLVSLKAELAFARSYIHIQSERFGNNLKLEWNIPETAMDAMIVPMSLQLLLENAIKHNVVSIAKPLVIKVSVENNNLIVDNKIQTKSTQLPSTKLGLKNIQKRYTLISQQAPEIKNDGTRFIVSLPLLKPTAQKKTYAHTDH